jgi:biotin carboxylase
MSKTLLLLGAGLEQCLALQEAKDLGYRVIAVDGNEEAPGLALADMGVTADITNPEAMIAIAKEHAVDGVFCHAVEIPGVTARVAQALNIPGLNPEIADRATNKAQRMQRFKEMGVPCAAFRFVASEKDLLAAARDLGFPLVLKPIDNAGSRGVRIVASGDQLEAAYREARHFSRRTEVLLEECLNGPEISTEAVVYQGKIHPFAFADRNYERNLSHYPYFVEDGINYPSQWDPAFQQDVEAVAQAAIKALDLDFGAAKGDLIVHNGVVKVIEMACRTSGGWFGAGSIPIATGGNMLRPLLQMAVGDDPDLAALKHQRQLPCAQRYWIPEEAGVVRAISGLEAAAASPGVAMFTPFPPKVGTTIQKARNNAERFAQVICTGETLDDAIANCQRSLCHIRIEVEPA